jgi:hypothetical protein
LRATPASTPERIAAPDLSFFSLECFSYYLSGERDLPDSGDSGHYIIDKLSIFSNLKDSGGGGSPEQTALWEVNSLLTGIITGISDGFARNIFGIIRYLYESRQFLAPSSRLGPD